ncbi:zinc-binding dehydrogenase [Agrococcus sp. Marseille-P2731]|uniref:zinc-binding dehydrogenase n=1 Tax=Agrococcus sp. Marseille-P2731 TaxID=1841862 RepID=UPI002286A578|nr:zinc-binding dehydrogenase [Agrococcus sp. Marseille-P2731]
MSSRWSAPAPGSCRVDARAMLAAARATDLEHVAAELAAGRLRPVMERTYPLTESVDALRTLEAGRVQGKLVVRVGE